MGMKTLTDRVNKSFDSMVAENLKPKEEPATESTIEAEPAAEKKPTKRLDDNRRKTRKDSPVREVAEKKKYLLMLSPRDKGRLSLIATMQGITMNALIVKLINEEFERNRDKIQSLIDQSE